MQIICTCIINGSKRQLNEISYLLDKLHSSFALEYDQCNQTKLQIARQVDSRIKS